MTLSIIHTLDQYWWCRGGILVALVIWYKGITMNVSGKSIGQWWWWWWLSCWSVMMVMMMMRRVMMMAPPVMLPSRLFAAKWTVRRWRKGSLPSYCNFLDSNFGKCFDFFTRPQLLDDWLTHFVTQQLFWAELRRGDAVTSWQSTLWDHPRSTQDLSGPDVSPQPPTPDHVTRLMGDQTDRKDWRS